MQPDWSGPAAARPAHGMPCAFPGAMTDRLRLIFARTSAWPSSLYRVLHEICADGWDREDVSVHECAPDGDEAFASMRMRILGVAGRIDALGGGDTICIADDVLAAIALRQLRPQARYAIIARPGRDVIAGMGHREVSSIPDAPRLFAEAFAQAELLLSTLEADPAMSPGALAEVQDRVLMIPPVIAAERERPIPLLEARESLGLPSAARVILVAWASSPDSPVSDLRQLLDGILADAPAARVLLLPIGERNASVDAFQSLRWMQGRVTVLHDLQPEPEQVHLAASDVVFVEPALAGDGFAIRVAAAGIRVMVRRTRGAPSVLAALLPPEYVVPDIRSAVSRLARIMPDTPAERRHLRERTLAFAGASAQRDRLLGLLDRLVAAAPPVPTEPVPGWHPFAVVRAAT